MMRSTPRRSLLIHIASGALAAAFVLLPQAAFAQRGGGHSGGGGGGHFGGGGSFGGGGGHSGGGSHSSAPVHSGSAPHSNPAPTPVPASHAPATEAPPVASSHPIGSSPVSAGSAAGTSRVVGPAEAARGTGIAVSGNSAAASRSATIGFPPASGGTGTFPSSSSFAHSPSQSGSLSFSGQGREVWRDSTASPATTNAARALESFAPATRGFHNRPSPPHVITGPRIFYPSYFYPGFAFVCPGFGYGYGFGFGCDPFWDFGCDTFGPGYGYGGGYYGNSYPSAPSGSIQSYSGSGNSSDANATPGLWRNPPADNSDSQGGNASVAAAPPSEQAPDSSPTSFQISSAAANSYTVIYLQDGASFAATDYWVADGQLHYVTSYGGENAVDLSQFDIERTTRENAKRGLNVTLRPAAAPSMQRAPDAQAPNAAPQQ